MSDYLRPRNKKWPSTTLSGPQPSKFRRQLNAHHGVHTAIMKLLSTIAIAALASLTIAPITAAEASAPVALSLISRTNDPAGKPIVRFRVSSTADAPYYYYYQTQVPTGTEWEFARTQSSGAASAHTLNAGETAFVEVAPPRGAARWRLQIRYKPHGPYLKDATPWADYSQNAIGYIKSEEIVER